MFHPTDGGFMDMYTFNCVTYPHNANFSQHSVLHVGQKVQITSNWTKAHSLRSLLLHFGFLESTNLNNGFLLVTLPYKADLWIAGLIVVLLTDCPTCLHRFAVVQLHIFQIMNSFPSDTQSLKYGPITQTCFELLHHFLKLTHLIHLCRTYRVEKIFSFTFFAPDLNKAS